MRNSNFRDTKGTAALKTSWVLTGSHFYNQQLTPTPCITRLSHNHVKYTPQIWTKRFRKISKVWEWKNHRQTSQYMHKSDNIHVVGCLHIKRQRYGGGDVVAKKIKVNKLSGKKVSHSHSLAATHRQRWKATFISLPALLLVMGSSQIAVVQGKVNHWNSWCNSSCQMSHSWK